MSKFVLTAQLQLQAPNNVGQVVQQIQNQLNGINVNIQVKGSQQAQKQIQQVTNSTNQATTAAERMGKAFALSIRRFAAFSIATRGVGLFTSSLSNAIQTAIDFERELIKVSQVTGKSIGQLRGLTNQITSLSTSFGVSSNDLLNVTTVLAQAGLTAEDTSKALRVLAKSALAPNFDSITETTEGAIAILAQFQEGVGALESQLGSINAVAGAFAVEAGDLIDVVRRTGGVFKSSGGSLNELLALFTSVRATTRESAESIGTGLRTIFTRIQRPKTIEFLKQFGVELVDLNGKFIGPYEAIKRLSEALSGLGEGDLTFIKIAEELGGFRQIGKVLPLLQQFSTAQSALNVAMRSGDSLTQDAASAQAALAIRIMRVREEFLALIRSVTETSTFQIMANTALSLASALIKIGDSIKPLLPMLAALAAFKIAKGLGGFFGGMMSGATSGRAYNKGGKVHHFAGGGLVPGTGNRDTVPAMLSPGEFVIRKSSVNKMGSGTLAAMNNNRYAMGGTVGAIALNPMDSQATGKGTVTVKDILATLSNNNQLAGGISGNVKLTDKQGKLQNLMERKEAPDGLTFGTRLEKLVSRIAFGGKNRQTFTTKGVAFPSTKNSDSSVEQGIKTGLTNAYTNIIPGVASQLASSVGLPTTVGSFNPNVIKSIGLEDATGKIFEAAVSSLGAPFDTNRAKQDRDAFDFPKGIGNHLGKFKAFSELANNPTDAKKSLDSSILNDIASRKTMNTLAEQVNTSGAFQALKKRVLSMEGTSKGRSEFDNPRGPKKKHFGGIIQKFAVGGKAKDTLQRYFQDSSSMNVGLANSKSLGKDQRKQLASDVKDMRQLRTQAPQQLYSSISRIAFDRMAKDVGLNKNPAIPEGTKLLNRDKYYQQEASKIVGKSFSLPGFVSTSKEFAKAKTFLDNAPRSEDNWAAMMTILTKKKAMGVDTAEQLKGRNLNLTKRDINPRSGKMETLTMNPPESESEFVLSPKSRFKVNSAKFVDMIGRKNLWMDVQQFNEGGKAGVPKRTIRGLFSDQDVAAAAQRKGMSFAQLKAELEARHDTGFKDYKIQDWEIKKKYGLIPSPFDVGAYSGAAAARDKEKTAAFHNRKRFAAGGGVGTDTVPALLTPGEFVVNRKSAQGIGYGALNRMNKVGKYAKGGVVQHFASGSTGTGVKPSSAVATPGLDSKVPSLISRAAQVLTDTFQSTSQAWRQTNKATDFIEKFSYELSDSLMYNSNANDYTAQQQAKLTDAYARAVQSMVKMGYSDDQIIAKSAELAAALDVDSKAKIASSKASTAAAAATSSSATSPSAPASSAAAAATAVITGKAPGNTAAAAANTTDSIVGKLSPKDAALVKDSMKKNADVFDKVTKEMQDMLYMEEEVQAGYKALARALKSGASAEAAHVQALAAADSSLNQSGRSNVNKETRQAYREVNAESTPTNSVEKYKNATKMEKVSAVLEGKASKGQVTAQDIGKGLGEGLTQAQVKAIAATNAQAIASQKAAQSNMTEASASDQAAKADAAEAGNSAKASGMNFGSMAMGLSMVSGTIQSMLPPLNENASLFTQMSHGILGVITTITGLAFAMSAFGITISGSAIATAASTAVSFLFGGASAIATAGMTAAATACTALAGSAVLATTANVSTGVMGALASVGLAGVAASAFTAAAAFITAMTPFIAAAAAIVAPLLLIVGAAYVVTKAFNFMIGAFYDKSKELKKATEEGKVSEASSLAGQQYDLEAANSVRALGGTIGAFFGGPLGVLIGAAIGNLGGTLLAYIAPGFAEGVNVFFGGNTRDSAIALAAAQAGAVKTQKALDEAQKIAATAMDDFKNGTISASDALAKIRAKSGEAASQVGRAASLAKENSKNRSTGALSYGRESMAYLSLGYVDSAKERNDKLSTQNVEQINNASKQQQEAFNVESPARQASIRSGVARGGNAEDIRTQAMGSLRSQREEALKVAQSAAKSGDDTTYDAAIAQAKQIADQMEQVDKEIANITKEVENAKKSFEAMNLGLRSATATASALSAGMDRFSAGLQVGGSTFVSDVEFLQQSLSSAAQSMDPDEIKGAMKNVSENLSKFGVSPQQIAKFEGNINAFTQAQANYTSAFANIKKSMKDADFKNLNSPQLKDKFAEELTKGMDKDAKKNLGDVIKGLDLQPDDVDKILAGDLSVFGDKLSESQKKMMEDVQKIAAERAKAEQVLIDFTKKRIDAERNLVQAQQEALDLTMEGREIQGKYGGRVVTGQERKDNLLAKSNVEGNRLGLSAMNTGDVGDLRRRNAEIKSGFSDIEGRRSQQGGMQGKEGVTADESQKDLQKAYKTQIDTIRGLIKLEEDQLKIIEEKNKLEKESMESLIKGDIEEFFKKQSAVGATAAIASGDTRLQNLYGADALGTAAMDIKRQQDAGVQSIYGQQLAGPGGLTEAASSAALSSRGVTDMRAAQVMAGTTAEEEASKTRLRELGGMLGETGQLGTELSTMEVNTAVVNLNTAELKFKETMDRGNKAAEEANRAENMSTAVGKSRGGMIYANRGIFVPRGTDTVPAMLTPGEFVVNRGAVQRGNNLQMLQSMNSGAGGVSNNGGTALMATGGVVRYRSHGSTGAEQPSQGMSSFTNALENFNRELTKNVQSLRDTKISIKLDSTSISVNLNDGGLLKALTSQVKTEIFNLVKNNLVAGDGGKLKESSSVLA